MIRAIAVLILCILYSKSRKTCSKIYRVFCWILISIASLGVSVLYFKDLIFYGMLGDYYIIFYNSMLVVFGLLVIDYLGKTIVLIIKNKKGISNDEGN